ncbi:MAG: putative OPT family oligopeptide transporter [Planctomycetota bacterium]|jgi:putative OPT family oligopeptide transporter
MKRDFLPILFGLIITAVLSGTFVIAGLKAGITPGVSPLVILCAWGLFAKRARDAGGTRFLNLTQVAGSGGMAVTAGVIFTAPVVQIVYRQQGLEAPPVDVFSLIILSLAGSLIGFGFVGLATKKFLSDPSLPAPEARACKTMISSAVAEASARPKMGRSLFAALLLGAGTTLLVKMKAFGGALTLFTKERHDSEFAFRLPLDAMLIGIGGLLTLPTALLVFGGAMIRMSGEFIITGFAPGSIWATERFAGEVDTTLRWAGGATMLVCVCYSLVRFLGVKKIHTGASTDEDLVLEVDPFMRTLLKICIAIGVVILVGWLGVNSGVDAFMVTMAITILVMALLMTTLGAILSLQIGSSASPVSGTIFVTTLVLCLAALATGHDQVEDVLILTPLLVGACVAVCSANDSSQDYKTMQLGGVRVQDGFVAQLLGLMVGCIVVPIVLYVADESFVLGSEALPAPQGMMFSTLISGLLLESVLPWWPIMCGLGLGVLAVLMEVFATRKGWMLPSMALAVGIYLPGAIGTCILMGAMFRFAGEFRHRKQTNESILSAAGLITGSALLELILGVMILFGFKEHSLEIFESEPMAWTAGLGILLIGFLLFWNSRRNTSEN